jgi:hypothetical protein
VKLGTCFVSLLLFCPYNALVVGVIWTLEYFFSREAEALFIYLFIYLFFEMEKQG